jgi:hypothetical protein
LEIASLSRDLPEVTISPVAGCATRPLIVLATVRLDRSHAQCARPESDAELRFAEECAERWSA